MLQALKASTNFLWVKLGMKATTWITKIQIKQFKPIKHAAFSHAVIIANNIFEDNTASENINLGITSINKLLGDSNSQEERIDSDQLEELYKHIQSSRDILNLLAEFNLCIAYIFLNYKTEEAKELAKPYLTNAKRLNEDAQPFQYKELTKRLKEVKTHQKALDDKLRKTYQNKVNEEKKNQIGKIYIAPSDITTLISVFSTLFLISGYYYINRLLAEFNLNSDHFYSISDYISTSVSFIITPLILGGAGFLFFISGAYNNLEDKIKAKQLGIKQAESKVIPYFFIAMNIISLILMHYDFYLHANNMIYLNALVLFFILLEKAPFHYFKNPTKVLFYTVACVGFIFQLNLRVDSEITRIQSEDYQPKYTLSFDEKIIQSKSLEFITMNSNYLIVRNINSKQLEVYPKSVIQKFKVNPAHESKVSSLELWFKFYHLIADDKATT